MRTRAELKKRRERRALIITRIIGALIILGTFVLIYRTGEWPLIVLALYGLYFLLGGRKLLERK
jgi:hypothetical protein